MTAIIRARAARRNEAVRDLETHRKLLNLLGRQAEKGAVLSAVPHEHERHTRIILSHPNDDAARSFRQGLAHILNSAGGTPSIQVDKVENRNTVLTITGFLVPKYGKITHQLLAQQLVAQIQAAGRKQPSKKQAKPEAKP